MTPLVDDFQSRCIAVATFWAFTLVCWLAIIAVFLPEPLEELKKLAEAMVHLADSQLFVAQFFGALVFVAAIQLVAAVKGSGDATVGNRIITSEVLSASLTFAIIFLLAALILVVCKLLGDPVSIESIVKKTVCSLFNFVLSYALWRYRENLSMLASTQASKNNSMKPIE